MWSSSFMTSPTGIFGYASEVVLSAFSADHCNPAFQRFGVCLCPSTLNLSTG